MVEIIKKEPITSAELRKEIDNLKKRDKELNFRAGKVEEYLNETLQIKPEDAIKLKEELISLEIPRLREIHIVKLVDTLPSKPEEVESVLEAYPITISKDNLKKISEVISKYLPKKKEKKSKKSKSKE
ncbi:MAG: DNA-directed polymerase subunit [Candidatus Woesearchaeota archaeon]|nr:DNA-directed polymerase subunit [Candidatus Woesearchaeota archaeon]MDN5327861.1 DNA-directed polymerase subunit [Candidatus Woesearchaeota archaeon]